MNQYVQTRYRPGASWLPRVVLGVPHPSNRVPGDCGVEIPAWKLKTHEAYDPGSREIADLFFEQSGAEVDEVIGDVSRLVAELNRRPEFACPDSVPKSKRAGHLKKYYWDFVNAMRRATERKVVRGNPCIMFDIHTCTDRVRGPRRYARMDVKGKKFFSAERAMRRPFGVEGDRDSILMKVFSEYLDKEFKTAAKRGDGLHRVPFLRAKDFKDPVGFNEPYDLSVGSPFREKVQGVAYANKYKFLSLTFETRNRIAKYPAVQRVALRALHKTLRDPRVNAEVRRLRQMVRQSAPAPA